MIVKGGINRLKQYVTRIGKHGPKYKGSSQYQLRVSLLNKVYKKIENSLEKTKKHMMNMVVVFSLMDGSTKSIEV